MEHEQILSSHFVVPFLFEGISLAMVRAQANAWARLRPVRYPFEPASIGRSWLRPTDAWKRAILDPFGKHRILRAIDRLYTRDDLLR